jgi:hypothetical protein
MLLFENHIPHDVEYEELVQLFCDFGKTINRDYIEELFMDEKSNPVLYTMDNSQHDISNCPCVLIYKEFKEGNTLIVSIMYIATKRRFRKVGYASLFVEEFKEYIKEKYIKFYWVVYHFCC